MNTRYFNYPADVIRWAVLLYVRCPLSLVPCPLSLRQVEDLLAERGIGQLRNGTLMVEPIRS